MEIIRQILEKKRNQVHSVSSDITVYDALKLMGDKNTGAVLVLEGQKICGIIGESDYARKIVLKGKSSKEVPVKGIISSEVICIDPDQSIANAQAIMIRERIRIHPTVFK
jgi:CBS domain-containing protein